MQKIVILKNKISVFKITTITRFSPSLSPSLPPGKPRSVGGSERVQLSGVFNVRKGKLALPVNRWSKRHVTLSGTCLIVSSVKHAHTGKMHILPLIGGKVFFRFYSITLKFDLFED